MKSSLLLVHLDCRSKVDYVGLPTNFGAHFNHPSQREREEFIANQQNNRFYPFADRDQYETAKKLTIPTIATRAEIEKWALRKSFTDHRPGLFNSTKEFFNCLDTLTETMAPWEKQTIRDKEGKKPKVVYYKRDTAAVLQEILESPMVKDMCVWAPIKMYSQEGERVYTDLHTSDWWWDMQVMPGRQ
jgi:hypothetical protein